MRNFRKAQVIPPDPENLVKSIASKIDSTLVDHVAALTRLNEAVSRDLQNPASTTTSYCCGLSGTSFDDSFRNSVDMNSYCATSNTWPSSQQFLVNTLPVMKENLRREPTLKWQYYGSRYGSSFVYPAVDRCQDNFDPRLKPWYYRTAGGTPKDVLILIDTSNTMRYTYGTSGTSKLNVAIGAAKNIVGTLIPDDRVGIISFSDVPEFPSTQNCYTKSLALASRKTKQMLSDYLDHLTYKTTNPKYSPVIVEAFRTFGSSGTFQGGKSNDNRLRVVLLLTDGRSTSDRAESLCAIRQGNAQLNNSVVFMTFGIDPSMTSEQQQFLQNIAQQDFSILCNFTDSQPMNSPQSGIFTQLANPDTNYVKTQIGFYYDAFANNGSWATTFSAPYNDAFGLGLVTSACQPVISSTQLLGVTCIDIALDIIFNDIINFELGQLSYAYLIDNYGRALLHPAIPRPEDYESDPLLVDISYLEINGQSAYIKNSMLSGASGSTSANANLVYKRGSSQIEGVDSFNKNVRYTWYPISVMNASMCLVIVEDEGKTVKNWTGPYPPVYLSQHVNIYDLSDPLLCNRLSRASSLAGTMVWLGPKSFVEPFNYSLVNNSVNPQTNNLKNYLEGKTDDIGNLTLKDGIRESVALTYALEDIWMKTTDPSDYWSYTGIRYIATEDGVFRKYPASPMPKQYDGTRRPWYTAAVGAGQLQKIVINRPHRDTAGQILITLCQAVFQNSGTSPSDSDPIFGVMGLDITPKDFYNLLITQFEPCLQQNSQSCLIVDNSGFVVVHEDYVATPPSNAEHITSKEPNIAFDLIQNSIMNIDMCNDYTDLTNQTFYEIDISQIRELASCTVYPVEGSNIFIIRPKDGATIPGACLCDSKNGNGACNSQASCQCPCYTDIGNSYCSGTISVYSNKRCLPSIDPPPSYAIMEIVNQGKKLKQCSMCNIPNLFITESECTQRSECCWDTKAAKCQSDCQKNTKVNTAAYVVPVVVGTLLLALTIAYLLWRQNSLKKRDEGLDSPVSISRSASSITEQSDQNHLYYSIPSDIQSSSIVERVVSSSDNNNSTANVSAPGAGFHKPPGQVYSKRSCSPPPFCPNCFDHISTANNRYCPSHAVLTLNLCNNSHVGSPYLNEDSTSLCNGGYIHSPDIVNTHSPQEDCNENRNHFSSRHLPTTTTVSPQIRVGETIQDSFRETIPKNLSSLPDMNTTPKILKDVKCEYEAVESNRLAGDNNSECNNVAQPLYASMTQSLNGENHTCCLNDVCNRSNTTAGPSSLRMEDDLYGQFGCLDSNSLGIMSQSQSNDNIQYASGMPSLQMPASAPVPSQSAAQSLDTNLQSGSDSSPYIEHVVLQENSNSDVVESSISN